MIALDELVGPRFLDGLIVFMAIELAVIGAWLGARGGQRFVGLLALDLLSGAALMGAVRVALVDETARFVALPLLLSLVAHVSFLARSKRLLALGAPAGPLGGKAP
ncbi:MAG: hypothetical protein U0900_16670 [Myxococcota bacterium]